MNNLQINIPKGHIVDLEKSNLELGVIHFKEVKKVVTYKDVAKKLFKEDICCSIGYDRGVIKPFNKSASCYEDPHLSKTHAQLESILALNKLCNVAKYLNGDWVPDYTDDKQQKWNIYYSYNNFTFAYYYRREHSSVLFKSEKLAKQAIDILGEEEVRKALTLNY